MGSTEGALRALGVPDAPPEPEPRRDAGGPMCLSCGAPERGGACVNGCG